jgi:CubicO group peptidase (beta-lactamase class C family)
VTQNCTEEGDFTPWLTACQANETILAFLAEMRDVKRPVIPAFQTALYSDSGFGVLGRILERLTNQTYAEALQTVLAGPLGLKGTSSIVLPDKGLNALAIPGNYAESSWGKDNQIIAP